MEMEPTIHTENMRYKEKKHQQVMENTQLALLNQGAIAAAMCTLADAIRGSRGIGGTSPPVDIVHREDDVMVGPEEAPSNIAPLPLLDSV
jgi:hypothetical protein